MPSRYDNVNLLILFFTAHFAIVRFRPVGARKSPPPNFPAGAIFSKEIQPLSPVPTRWQAIRTPTSGAEDVRGEETVGLPSLFNHSYL